MWEPDGSRWGGPLLGFERETELKDRSKFEGAAKIDPVKNENTERAKAMRGYMLFGSLNYYECTALPAKWWLRGERDYAMGGNSRAVCWPGGATNSARCDCDFWPHPPIRREYEMGRSFNSLLFGL